MAGAYRPRGKQRYTAWWIGADGRKHTRAGTSDRATTEAIARKMDAEARQIKAGVIDPGEGRRREAGLRSVADHVLDYQAGLVARGGTSKHAGHVAGAILRLLDSAEVRSINDLAADRIVTALGRLKVARSARTANHAMGALRAFARWLEHNGRIREVPPGIRGLRPFNERVDRRRVRRALTREELSRLYVSAEQGPDFEAARGPRKGLRRAGSLASITGPDRAMLYRLAAGTGFRVGELRSLTPESFDIDTGSPTITVGAAYSKHRREDVQPITNELADHLWPWLDGKSPGVPVLTIPVRTAEMLSRDLKAAGIAVETKQGIVDFHSLRHTFVSLLVSSGASVKVAQSLARHSDPSLTIGRYSHADDADLRGALKKADGNGNHSP